MLRRVCSFHRPSSDVGQRALPAHTADVVACRVKRRRVRNGRPPGQAFSAPRVSASPAGSSTTPECSSGANTRPARSASTRAARARSPIAGSRGGGLTNWC
jgi:hypothetical protein